MYNVGRAKNYLKLMYNISYEFMEVYFPFNNEGLNGNMYNKEEILNKSFTVISFFFFKIKNFFSELCSSESFVFRTFEH